MFKIDDKYLHPLEEIVVDPEEALRLGVKPFTAHNLRMPNGTPVLDYINKIHMKIWNLRAVAEGTTVVLTWEGETNVDIIIDNEVKYPHNIHPNGINRHTVTLPRGRHTFKLTEWSTLHPLYAEVFVEGAVDERYSDCSISVKEVGKHSFILSGHNCGDLWVTVNGSVHKLTSNLPITGLDPDTDYPMTFTNKAGETVKNITARTDGMSLLEKAYELGKAPVITQTTNIAVDDTMAVGDLVGTFKYNDGGLPITFVGLLGQMAEYLNATIDGNIYIKKMPVGATPGSWTLVLEVANGKGADTAGVGLVFSSETPTFTDNLIIDISETTPVGTVLGNIAIDDKGKPPITITLPAELDYYLDISDAGVVTLANIADYEALSAGFNVLSPTKKEYKEGTITVTNAVASRAGKITMRVSDDIADNPPAWLATTPSTIEVEENKPVGTVLIADLNTYLNPDATTYTLSDTVNFQIVGNALQTNAVFDYETTQSYTVTITPDNAGRVGIAKTILVKVKDMPDIAPTYTVATATESMAENNVVGTEIGTYTANTGTAPITYTIDDTTNFNIDSTGKVTAKVVYDFETKNSYTFVVTATNGFGSATKTVTLSITDISTDKPVFGSASYTATIAENNAIGASIVTTSATSSDPSALVYTISDTTNFNIDSATGAVTAKVVYDYETTNNYSVTVTATNNAGATNVPLTVNITDMPDIAPTYTAGASSSSMLENVAIGTEIGTYTANTGTAPITYTIDDTTNFDIDSSTAKVTTKKLFNYETDPHSYSFVVTATNAHGSADRASHTVALNNVAELPIWASATDTVSFEENNTVGSTVGTYTASKPAGNSRNITYTLMNGTAEFALDSATGVLTTKKAFDYETDPTSYNLGIRATNSDGSADLTLTVNITDKVVEVVPPTIDPTVKLEGYLGQYAYGSQPFQIPISSDGGATVTAFEVDWNGIQTTDVSGNIYGSLGYTMYSMGLKDADKATGKMTIINNLGGLEPYNGIGTTANAPGWTVPALQQDTAGGMNDYVTATFKVRAENSAGWGNWQDVPVKMRNKPVRLLAVEAGKTEPQAVGHLLRRNVNVEMLNLAGVDSITSMGQRIADDGGFGQALDSSKRDDFNKDLSRWNTSSITDFSSTFRDCASFNQDLNAWNTTSATSWGSFYVFSALETSNVPSKFR